MTARDVARFGSVEVRTDIRRLGTREGSIIFAFLIPGVTEFYVDYNFSYRRSPRRIHWHRGATGDRDDPAHPGFGGLPHSRPVRGRLARVSPKSGTECPLLFSAFQCPNPPSTVGCQLVEVGGFIGPEGNDFWGVETFVRNGETIILMSDRDSGLFIFMDP